MAVDTHVSAPFRPTAVTDAVLDQNYFGKSAMSKASSLQWDDCATIDRARVEGGAWILEAQVRGTRTAPYRQTIRISRRNDGRIAIKGDCSCPMTVNCKHVAAAIMQWRRDAKEGRVPAGPPPAMLSPQLTDLISRLRGDFARAEENAADVRKRLHYIVMPHDDGGIAIDVVARDLDKNGQPTGAPKDYDANSAGGATPAKFLRASDLAVLPRLAGSGYGGVAGRGRYRLSGRDSAILFAQIVDTGRVHWRDIEGVRLIVAEPRAGSGVWRVDADGAQRFTFAVAGAERGIAFALGTPHYIDPESGATGRLDTALPDAVACRLLAAPPVRAEEAVLAADALARVLPKGSVPMPASMGQIIDERPTPVRHVRLTTKKAPRWYGGGGFRADWSPERTMSPVVELGFDYAGVRLAPDDPRPNVSHHDGAAVRRIHRDPAFEAASLKRLFGLGLEAYPTDWSHTRSKTPATLWLGDGLPPHAFATFLLDGKPMLEADGWVVDVDVDFPLRLVLPDGDRLSLDVRDPAQDESGIDWFDLSLGVKIDGQRLDLMPVLSQMLAALPPGDEQAALAAMLANAGDAARLLVTLPDGRVLPLPLASIVPVVEGLLAIWGPIELKDGARLHPAQARDLADLEAGLGGHVDVTGGARLRALADELAAFRERAPAQLPPWFAGSLRPYQQTGVDWLQMLSRTGFGGILADDMGLGKTIQLLAHLAIEKAAGRLDAPALVVAPTSVLGNWRAEAARFAPELTTLVHQGLERAKGGLDTTGIDVVITSYPLLARDKAALLDRRWSVAALDEAQTIRNPQAGTTLAAFALDAGQRIALSGTPVENHLGDVWSLMRFLNPGLLGDAKSFRQRYRTPIEKKDDADARARLSRRLKPFLLRRTKAEVAADLPEKTEIRESVTLTPAQRQLYEATRLAMQRKVREALDGRGLGRSAIVILDALLKLRQACCDPRLVRTATDKAKAGGSAKLERLIELIEELKAEGRSALIFSQFTSMLDLIRAELETRGWDHAWLTGDTVDRAAPVARFQAGEVDLFLISLKAGGVGLNLTRADTVILYDPWWNPAVEAQAIDRAHRIGQMRKIFIHRLIAEDSVEEKMLALQERKRGFADALWDGGSGGFAGLSDEDVRGLFE